MTADIAGHREMKKRQNPNGVLTFSASMGDAAWQRLLHQSA